MDSKPMRPGPVGRPAEPRRRRPLWLVVTDLDGTLLDDGYDLATAAPLPGAGRQLAARDRRVRIPAAASITLLGAAVMILLICVALDSLPAVAS